MKKKMKVLSKLKSHAQKKSNKPATDKATKKAAPKNFVTELKGKAEKIIEQVSNIFAARPKDMEAAIKMDHDSLRNFLKTLKDTDKDMTERRRAYAQFASLLQSHSDCEEQVAYKTAVEFPGHEMHIKIAEGYVEHQLASDLMARIEKTTDALTWSAHANVLSEIIEHHLKEEERDLLPLMRKATSASVDAEMLTKYLFLREGSQKKVTEKNSGVLKSLS